MRTRWASRHYTTLFKVRCGNQESTGSSSGAVKKTALVKYYYRSYHYTKGRRQPREQYWLPTNLQLRAR